jgi:transposase-like protein
MADVQSMSFLAVGRKYGVTDNAVRKWIRWYEHQAERERARHDEDEPPMPEHLAA